MSERVLVTGGAGFIGRHVCKELLRNGYQVRVLDNMDAQVHGPLSSADPDLEVEVDLRVGSVTDGHRLRVALKGCEAVVHLAAAVGVGQSMYEPHHYMATNALGTATLMDALMELPRPRPRLVVASSMSIYGEGGDERVRETRGPDPRSVYALSKYDQEKLCLLLGDAYAIPTVALRFFNVYGPGQALRNPYTGVMAIFASQLLNGHRPLVYEDGKQTRDFVHVDDVARAVVASLFGHDAARGEPINIGTGRAIEVRKLAFMLAYAMDRSDLTPNITDQFRVGDIRHCVADITKARLLLEWEPMVQLADGLRRQAKWLEGQHAPDNVDGAHAELREHKLIR